MKIRSSLLSILLSAILISISIFVVFYFLEKDESRIVYVDNAVLFSRFNMSKDLSQGHQKNLGDQKRTVDSLLAILQDSEANIGDEELRRNFVFENNKLKEMGDYFTNNVSQQVWSRLNSYMQEYGAQKNYSIIMGTQGNGNIMYAQKHLDVTQDFIEFANKKYEGE